ncbi:MAG TPA: MBL fold metallo-hydrolase [Candidatus Deferrimicrobium sp.]|nr:MBL fold metallo-hydrolase [Candidatus Deferrimicrobium sp.]
MEQINIYPGIWLIKPPRSQTFGGCYGLVIKSDRDEIILIDCNFPKELMEKFLLSLDNQVDYYFITHFHMDHTANVHFIEEWTEADILMPQQEIHCIRNLNNLIEFVGANTTALKDAWKHFGYEMLQFKECQSARPFNPGTLFTFGNVSLQTLHLPGHSPGHTGFIISNSSSKDRILHVADLGIDSFGPWYGNMIICNLSDYLQSIQKVETLIQDCNILLSCHTDAFTSNFQSIIEGMRIKIIVRDGLLLNAIKGHLNPITLEELKALDLFFSKNKFSPLQRQLYSFWEENFLQHHLIRLIQQQKIIQDQDTFYIKQD